MTGADLRSANELRRLAGWNQTEEDCRRLLDFAPRGCFVATEDARVIGTVTTTTYGAELAWIGMMLVHPEHRRRGIATRLMNCALEHLRASGIKCVKLDATPAGRPLYERLGFREESKLTRWQRDATAPPSAPQATNLTMRTLQPSDWHAIERIDAAAFGVQRGFLLKRFAQAAVRALVWPGQGPILGWGLLRAGAHSDYLGPVEGASDGLPSLVANLLAGPSSRVTLWDLPDDQAMAIETAKRLGFETLRPLARMRLGPEIAACARRSFFGIVDPAVG